MSGEGHQKLRFSLARLPRRSSRPLGPRTLASRFEAANRSAASNKRRFARRLAVELSNDKECPADSDSKYPTGSTPHRLREPNRQRLSIRSSHTKTEPKVFHRD